MSILLPLSFQDGAPNARFFSRPTSLSLLASYTLRAHTGASSSNEKKNLPLVMSAPLDEAEGTCLVVGVPPVNDR